MILPIIDARDRRSRASILTYSIYYIWEGKQIKQTSKLFVCSFPSLSPLSIRGTEGPEQSIKYTGILYSTKSILASKCPTIGAFWDNFVLRAGTRRVPREQNYPHTVSFFIFSSDITFIFIRYSFNPSPSFASNQPGIFHYLDTYQVHINSERSYLIRLNTNHSFHYNLIVILNRL